MTGEMSASEVTRDNFPELFALRDALKRRGIKATPKPFDQYQGPYLNVPGFGDVWYSPDDDAAAVWMRTKKPVYAGGLFIIERGRAFIDEGGIHRHEATETQYAVACFTLRQAARTIARYV